MPTTKSGPSTKSATPATSTRSDRTLRRQGEATRAKLLATVPALAAIGFQGARVDDVVRLAGVSHGTFYLYFANKEDLFRAAAEQCAAEAAELAASLGPVSADAEGRAVLREWLGGFVAFYRRYGVVVRAWSENQVTDRELAKLGTRSFGSIVQTLRAAMADGSDATPREIELRATALIALVERFSYIVTSRDLGIDDETTVEHLAAFVHRGFFGG